MDHFFLSQIQNPGSVSHIFMALLAFSTLGLAFIQAVLLSLQDRALRSQRLIKFTRWMPPLQTMETLLFRFISLGLMFLSVVLVSGFLGFDQPFTPALWQKAILAGLAWGVFALLLLGRLVMGWRGAVAIRLTEAGMGLLLLAYIGSRIILV